jgi:LysM repeat protein
MSRFSGNTTVIFWVYVWVISISACAPANLKEFPTPSAERRLVLYASSTPTKINTPKSDPRKTQNLTPSPTLTPNTYTIVDGDTLLEIALNFGIPLDKLLASNPSVDPRFLSVGTVIVIPRAENLTEDYSTPTPFPIAVDVPLCYPVKDGGVWCFAMVTNNYLQPMEGISGQITLFAPDGSEVGKRIAHTPLNTLLPGETMPLIVYFLPPIHQEFLPHLNEVSALLVNTNDERNIPVTNMRKEVNISPEGTSAAISGSVLIPEDGNEARRVSMLAIAYSDDDNVVGVRREDKIGPFKPGEKIFFEVTVYTLGSPIHKVDMLGEAYP